jgi:Iap family predicted aminopeptidase
MNTRRLLTTSLIVVLLTVSVLCDSVDARPEGIVYSTQEQVFAETQAAPCRDEDRLAAVQDLFKRCGAADADLEVREEHGIKNVVVTIKGSGQGTLVVGAHYDKVSKGCGAIDNWTGVVLLAHVYKTLRQVRPSRTILFVAFGAEEEGLRGSRAMVSDIAKPDRWSYCAMVNLDSFGLARPQVLDNVTTPKLRDFTKTVAQKCKVAIATASLEGLADADSSSFKAAGIPAITLHGVSNDWAKILHTPSDQAGKIQSASVYLGYILTLNLVAELDACDCSRFR